MRTAEMRLLVEFNAWVNHRLLDAAAGLTDAQFRDPAAPTNLGLRASLVHMLDIEWSWRLAISDWKAEDAGELATEDYPTLAALRTRWRQDESEMAGWLDTLTDADMDAMVSPGSEAVALPCWVFLMHLLMHSRQLQADVATILSGFGHSPGDLDFLDFIDERSARAGKT